ncbi:MAG TPA: FAD-dependent oxidoreductase [Woeseiaceae bacterium]|nr:FAD-dependent oxidoreductase [Woeseiaceae bacterium]
MAQQVVIAGAGHAAGQVVASLRQKGFGGDIVLVGEEAWLPYQRPPLSKKYLAGELPPERLYFKPADFYVAPGIDVRLQTRITAVDREQRYLTTATGERIPYDTLVLATGSRARPIRVPGSDKRGLHYLRGIDDVSRIRAALDSARNVVIIGGGYIGLEVAAVIRQLGHDVCVIEMADRVMSRVVSPAVSAFFQAEHTAHGVHLLLSTGLEAFEGDAKLSAVQTTGGASIPADLVIAGIGIVPNTELAASAGLEVDNGIVVDARCRTADPAIYAVGDCTSHPNPIYGRRIRLESVHNALEQAKTAAANICGEPVEYAQVPWFWSDQYDLKLQIAGLSEGYDEAVIRGEPATRSFSCLYLRDGVLIACDAINAPRDFVQSKALIAARLRVAPDRLADTSVPLGDLT